MQYKGTVKPQDAFNSTNSAAIESVFPEGRADASLTPTCRNCALDFFLYLLYSRLPLLRTDSESECRLSNWKYMYSLPPVHNG